MGASVSVDTVVTSINNEVRQYISQISEGKAHTKCIIEFGSIKGKYENCKISMINSCYAEVDIKLESLAQAAAKFVNNLSVEQKQEAANWFTVSAHVATTSETIQQSFSQYLEQKCKVQADAEAEIKVENMDIDCKSTGENISIDFHNFASSNAVCAMKQIAKLEAQFVTEQKVKQSSGMDWSKIIWPLGIILIVAFILFIIFTIIKKNIPSAEQNIELEKIKSNNYSSRISSLIHSLKKDL